MLIRSSIVLRSLLFVGLIVVCVTGGQAQQQPGQTGGVQPPTDELEQADAEAQPVTVFRSGINFIRVDTIVMDSDGNHVTDLEASDFEVYEDGELQAVETFDLVEIGALPEPDARPPTRIVTRADEEREASRSDVRVVVVFFDDYHVRVGAGQRAGQAIAKFLRNNLYPADLVAVMYPLTPLMDLRLTRNHDLVIDQVESFFGRKYDYEPSNRFEQQYASYPREVIEQIRNDVSMSALNGLMIHLGGLREARKSVLLVSEGYTNYVPPQFRDAGLGQTNPARFDPSAAENSFEVTHQFFRDSEVMLRIRELYQTANRFNTSIYSLDPRGLAVGEFDLSQPNIALATNRRMLRVTQDTLHILSDQSDGRAIVNQNDLDSGLRQMMSDSSAYYLLGYQSTQSPTDGKFHEIEVKVRREGIQVRSRPGFWAVTERDVARALTARVDTPPKAVDVALSGLAEPRRGHLIRTWVGTARGENGRTRVTFVWEPTGGPSRGEDPARVLLTAMGDAGGAFYRGRVPEPAGRPGRGAAGVQESASGSLTMVTFEADPGAMQLSVAVEGEGGEVIDRDRDQIDVPDFSGPDVVLSTPAFVRARTNLEWRDLVEDWDALPTVSREFRRTERILLRFEAYAPGAAVPRVESWLLNRRGDRMYPLVVQPAADGRRHQVDIQPTGLPPGEYVVELRATALESETTQLVAFRLGS